MSTSGYSEMNTPLKNQDCKTSVDFTDSTSAKPNFQSFLQPPSNPEYDWKKVMKYGGAHASSLDTTAKVSTPEVDQFEEKYRIPNVPDVPCRLEYGPTIAYTRTFYGNEEGHDVILRKLQELPYEPYTIKVQGNTYTPIRKVLAYADPGISYTFGSVTLQCQPWSTPILDIKTRVEKLLDCSYNHALLSYLPNVKARINPHIDNEVCIDTTVPIAMVFFGTTTRQMVFNREGRRPFKRILHSGSIMTLYNQEWQRGILSDRYKSDGIFFLITFHKILIPTTPIVKLPPQQIFSKSIDIHLTPTESDTISEPATKKICMGTTIEDTTMNTIAEDIPGNDWLTIYDQAANNAITPTALKNEDLKRFWLSKTVALSVQMYRGELCVHIREYYPITCNNSEMLPTKRGCCLDLHTFYEFSRKIENISRSLKHNFESTTVNNCLLLTVQDEKLHIRRFNSVILYPHEIILNVTMFKRMVEQMWEIHNFIMNYQFNILLKSKVCLTIPELPYMEQSLNKLKDIIQNSLHNAINLAFHCKQCFSAQNSMDTHECLQLHYSQKYKQLPYYTAMLCDIKRVAEEYLKDNRKLSHDHYDFTHLYTKTFLGL